MELGRVWPGIDKMGDVPVVRMFAARLGKIHARSLGAEENGFIGHVIPGLGDAFRAEPPVDRPDRLAVTVDAAVGHVYLAALPLHLHPIAPYFRRRRVLLGVRHKDHDENDQRENHERAGGDGRQRHFHFVVAPGLKNIVLNMLYKPMYAPTMMVKPSDARAI
jgi:hypothetical protein